MKLVSRRNILDSLADLSINLASGWLGVLLISPGFLGVSFPKYMELLLFNFPPAIIALLAGMFLRERMKRK